MQPIISIAPPPVNQLAIERLEDILARAKSGEIDGFACATVNTDGSAGSAYVTSGNVFTLLGSIRSLEHDLLENEVE